MLRTDLYAQRLGLLSFRSEREAATNKGEPSRYNHLWIAFRPSRWSLRDSKRRSQCTDGSERQPQEW